MLKYHYASAEDIPDAVKAYYKEHDDGSFQLDVEGAVSKSVNDKFRQSNIQLSRRVEELEQRYKGLDINEFDSIRKRASEADDLEKKLKEVEMATTEKLDELRSEWTKEVAADRDKGFKARDEENARLTQRLRHLTITTALQKSATDANLEPWAITDAVMLGERIFDLDDKGNVVAIDVDAATGTKHKRFDANGDPLTITTWLQEQIAARPGWLPASAGGGAQHQNGVQGRNSKRTPSIDGLSMSERLTLARKTQKG